MWDPPDRAQIALMLLVWGLGGESTGNVSNRANNTRMNSLWIVLVLAAQSLVGSIGLVTDVALKYGLVTDVALLTDPFKYGNLFK